LGEYIYRYTPPSLRPWLCALLRRPNYGNRPLLSERSAERSVPKIGWIGERALQKNDGAGGRGPGTEQGAEVTGLGWSVERLFRPLRSAHIITCSGLSLVTLQFDAVISFTTVV